jgi:hypothetical protein
VPAKGQSGSTPNGVLHEFDPRYWLNKSTPRLGERAQAHGQTVQLPRLSESGGFRPGWNLVLQRGERRGFVHCRYPAVEAQTIRLLLESTLGERVIEGAVPT